MKLQISQELLNKIYAHGEETYPEEGAGFLLGRDEDGVRQVVDILPLTNSREDAARHNRYLLSPQDMLTGEKEAMRKGLDVVGVFHSHPDHPNRPSEFDREWAMPWFSYVITSIKQGIRAGSRSWRLADDRERFDEEEVLIMDSQGGSEPRPYKD
jgi:proteasome lid subunit RPN8/RPN11